jgi:nucleotide-binding universal stress UspA family protein
MYQRILVPVDGSELSDRAIVGSIELARQLGAAVIGFVAEPLMAPVSGPRQQSLLEDQVKGHDAMTEAHAREVLSRFEARAGEAGVSFEGHYDQVANVDRAIIAAAESHRCDMIVMVTHGRGAFGEFLFGSHTKAVLAGSTLPLLVLH